MSGTFLIGLLAMMYKELSGHKKKKAAQFTKKRGNIWIEFFPPEKNVDVKKST